MACRPTNCHRVLQQLVCITFHASRADRRSLHSARLQARRRPNSSCRFHLTLLHFPFGAPARKLAGQHRISTHCSLYVDSSPEW
jgi:hypothetical protein